LCQSGWHLRGKFVGDWNDGVGVAGGKTRWTIGTAAVVSHRSRTKKEHTFGGEDHAMNENHTKEAWTYQISHTDCPWTTMAIHAGKKASTTTNIIRE
jgi:hypothetical protein